MLKRMLSAVLAAAMIIALVPVPLARAAATVDTTSANDSVESVSVASTEAGKVTVTFKLYSHDTSGNFSAVAFSDWAMDPAHIVDLSSNTGAIDTISAFEAQMETNVGPRADWPGLGCYGTAGEVDIPGSKTCTFDITIPESGDTEEAGGANGYNQSGGVKVTVYLKTNQAPRWGVYTFTLPQSGEFPPDPADIATITWDKNGGTSEASPQTTQVAKGDPVGSNFPTSNPNPPAGYVFKGWYTAASGGTEVTATTTVADSVTYYAQWNKLYNLKFDLNGGTNSGTAIPNQQLIQGATASLGLPAGAVLEKTGFNFLGWATSNSATSALGSFTMPASDTTLYAVWGTGDTVTINASDITATYGDAAQSIGATTTSSGTPAYAGTLQYAVTDGSSDVITVDASGNVTFVKPGTKTITITAPANGTYAAATATITVTVNKAASTAPTVNNSKKADSTGGYNTGEITVTNFSSLGAAGGVEYVQAASAPASGGGTAGAATIGSLPNGQYWVRTTGNDYYEPSAWVGVYVNSTFTVSYDANSATGSWTGGTGTVDTNGSDSVQLGALAAPATNPTNTDTSLKFNGWSTTSGASNSGDKVSSTTTISADTTLYAIWSNLTDPALQVEDYNKTYGDPVFQSKHVRTGDGAEHWELTSGSSVNVDASGKITIVGVGDSVITYSVDADSTGTYAPASKTFTVKVSPKKLTASDIDWSGVSFSAMTYNGKTYTDIPSANVTGTPGIKTGSLVNSSDTVTLTPVYTRNTSKANTSGEQVNVELTLTDPTGKYVLDSSIDGTAFDSGKKIVVNKVKLTVADVQIEKVYDGTNTLEADDTTAITSATLTGLISGDTVTLDASGVTYLNSGKVTTTTSDGGYDVLKAANQLTLTGAEAGNYEIDSSATGAGRILGKVTPASLGTLTISATNTTYKAAETAKGTVTVTGCPAGVTIAYKVVDDTTTTITDETGWTGVTSSGAFATINGTTGKITGVKATGNTGDPATLTVWARVSKDNYETQYISATFQVEKAEQTLTANPSSIPSGFYTSTTKDVGLTSNAVGEADFNWANVTASSAAAATVTVSANAVAGTGNTGKVTLSAVAAGGPTDITITAPATANYKAATATVPVTVLAAGANTLALTENAKDVVYGDALDISTLLKLQNSNGAITYALDDPTADSSKVTLTGSTLTAKDHAGTVVINITQGAGVDTAHGNAPVDAITTPLQVTVTLKPRVVTVSGTVTATDRKYDTTTNVTIPTDPSTLTITNKVGSDDVSLTGSFTGTIADPDVGSNKAVTLNATGVSLTGADAAHYTLTVPAPGTGTAWPSNVKVNITKADVTGWVAATSGVSATKTYNGSGQAADLTLGNMTLTGVNGETFTLTANKTKVNYKADLTAAGRWNAGDTCSFEIALSDFTVAAGSAGAGGTTAKESNYNMPSTKLTYNTGEITKVKVTLTLSGKDAGNNALGANQTYGDGPFTLSVKAVKQGTTDPVTLSNIGTVTYTPAGGTGVASVSGNTLTIEKSGAFTVTATAAGTDNYEIVANAATDTLSCTVAKKELTVSPDTISEKFANGTTGKTLVDSDYVAVPTGAKDLATAGADITFTVNATNNNTTAAIDGSQKLTWATMGPASGATSTIDVTMAANDYYTLAPNSKITLTVTDKDPVTVTFNDATFSYNGAARTYDELKSKLIVTGKTHTAANVTFTYVDGATTVTGLPKDAGTYTVTATYEDTTHRGSDTATITITKAPVTIQVADTTKTYGDSSVTWGAVSIKTGYTLQGADVGNETTILGNLTLASTGEAAATEVGKYAITVTDGNPVQNYTWTVDSTSKLEVTKKDITVTAAPTKTYDGTDTISGVTWTLVGAVNNDDLSTATLGIDESAVKYNSKNVHTGEDLTGTLKLTGTKAKNYNLTTVAADIDGTITPMTGVITALKPTTTISGNTIKLSDVITAAPLAPRDTPNALVTKPDGTEDWIYDGNGGYTSPTTGVKATVYEKQPDGTYALITGSPTAGKTYYVDVNVPTGTLGNYTVATGHPEMGHAPADDTEANGGNYCKLTISRAPSSPVVSYIAGEHGKLAEGSQSYELVRIGEKPVNVPEVEPDEGYRFAGWSTDGGKTFVKPDEVEVTGSITYMAIFEEDSQHIAYMIGRGDKQFVPNGNLTRAEAAAILARLSPDFSESKEYGCTFTDVNRGVWFYNYIAFCQTKGIVIGNGDNTFRPDSSISRAELAAMVVRFLDVNPNAWKCTFTDVSEKHWANGYIAVLQRLGIVKGDGNGKFRPGDPITRYETTILINRAINRTPDPKLNLKDGGYRNPFSDITEAQWYYEDVVEATVDHNAKDFHRDPVTGDTTDSLPGTSRSREDDKDKDKDSKKEENATEPKVD